MVIGAVATGSEVGVTAAAIEVAVGDVLSVGGVSFDDESEHPIIASVVRAIRALSRDNVINRRWVGMETRLSGCKNRSGLRPLLRTETVCGFIPGWHQTQH